MFALTDIKKASKEIYSALSHKISQTKLYFRCTPRTNTTNPTTRVAPGRDTGKLLLSCHQAVTAVMQGEAAGAAPVCRGPGGEVREAPGLLQDAGHAAPARLLQHHLQLPQHGGRPAAQQEAPVLLRVQDLLPH